MSCQGSSGRSHSANPRASIAFSRLIYLLTQHVLIAQEGSTIKLVFERGLHRALITCFLVRGDHRKGIARPWSNSPKVSTHVAPPKRSHAPSSKVPDYQLGTAGSKALQEGAAPAARASRQNEALFPSLEYFGGTTNVPAAVATRSRVPSEALMRSANRRSSGSQSRIEAPRHSTPMPQELPSGHTFLERRARLIWEQCRSSNAESDDSSSCDDAPSKSRGLRGAGCSRSSMSTSRTRFAPPPLNRFIRAPSSWLLIPYIEVSRFNFSFCSQVSFTILTFSPRHPARLRCADMDGGEQTSNLLANARRIWAQCKSVENDEPTEGADEI